MSDVEKIARRLNENMTHAVMRAYKGSIQCDVPKTTQNALVKRDVAFWPPGEDMCADLTELGLQVHSYLKEKAKADQDAKDRELAAKFAAERKIRDEGYEAGRLLAQRQNEDQIKNLWNTIQILISRYPNCETVLTGQEIEERSDLGVVCTAEEQDGLRMWVRQR